MAWYRKKPVVVEAYQISENWMDDIGPDWFLKAWDDGKIYLRMGQVDKMFIETLEGEHIVSPGDYIIKGVEGELYLCKPSIFKKTYEKVEEGI